MQYHCLSDHDRKVSALFKIFALFTSEQASCLSNPSDDRMTVELSRQRCSVSSIACAAPCSARPLHTSSFTAHAFRVLATDATCSEVSLLQLSVSVVRALSRELWSDGSMSYIARPCWNVALTAWVQSSAVTSVRVKAHAAFSVLDGYLLYRLMLSCTALCPPESMAATLLGSWPLQAEYIVFRMADSVRHPLFQVGYNSVTMKLMPWVLCRRSCAERSEEQSLERAWSISQTLSSSSEGEMSLSAARRDSIALRSTAAEADPRSA